MSGDGMDPRQRIEAVAQRVHAAREDIAADRGVDLAGLQDDVKLICDLVRDLPSTADRAGLADAVEKLIADFDDLEAALTAQHERRSGGTDR
ncbi:MAG: hypothetical protein OXR84_04630 [Magnetovibrio sp.]|nr:hypothetical protein [Magnetovibrio sp.]